MTIFEKAMQPETRQAFVDYKLRKRRYSKEENEAMAQYVLSDDCVRDIQRLQAGDFFLDYPDYRLIPKNFDGRKRAIYRFRGTQGALLKLLVFAMKGVEQHYSDRLFSFRSDRTATDLLEDICSCEGLENMYIFKTDVTNYVGSIVPEIIIPMLADIYLEDDPGFYNFLEWLLMRKKVIDRDGNVIDHCPGGMGGIPVANFFMNLYLHEMDEYFAPRAAFYSRYSDDILICAHTYEEIKEFEAKFFEILGRLQLRVNMEKTEIQEPGSAFDMLGMEICGSSVTISRHSMNKIKRKLRKFTDRALIRANKGYVSREQAAKDIISRFNRFFFGAPQSNKLLSWAKWAYPVITDTACLEEIDHYFQNSIRYVLYGSMKLRNRTIPYEKLHELGYRSLVYYYHHQDKIYELLGIKPDRKPGSEA